MPGLEEAILEIRDALGAALEADATSGGLLEDVETVLVGKRTRPMPRLPAIWVGTEPATFRQGVYGDSEDWTLPVTLAALVKNDQPDEGEAMAASMAARAKRSVLRDRHLGLGPWVTDMLPLTFEPDPLPPSARNQFWAYARIEVQFTVTEDEGS